MPLADVISLISGLLGAAGAVAAVLYAARRNRLSDLSRETRAQTKLEQTSKRISSDLDKNMLLVAAIRHDLNTVQERIAVIESKIDVFWKNVAYDVSQILHSPHAGWERLDSLLEQFRDRTITPAGMEDLMRNLRVMVAGEWESPVSRADQVAATLLLHAIEQVNDHAE